MKPSNRNNTYSMLPNSHKSLYLQKVLKHVCTCTLLSLDCHLKVQHSLSEHRSAWAKYMHGLFLLSCFLRSAHICLPFFLICYLPVSILITLMFILCGKLTLFKKSHEIGTFLSEFCSGSDECQCEYALNKKKLLSEQFIPMWNCCTCHWHIIGSWTFMDTLYIGDEGSIVQCAWSFRVLFLLCDVFVSHLTSHNLNRLQNGSLSESIVLSILSDICLDFM